MEHFQGAILSLSGEIDRMDDTLRVVITATDKGGLTGTCTVTITVTDVNTAPVFLIHPFTVHIPENIPIGSEVIQLKAEDQDRHENAKLTYSVGKFDDYSLQLVKMNFAINTKFPDLETNML